MVLFSVDQTSGTMKAEDVGAEEECLGSGEVPSAVVPSGSLDDSGGGLVLRVCKEKSKTAFPMVTDDFSPPSAEF